MKYRQIKKSLLPVLQEKIMCACGCGQEKDRYDKYGREILYMKSHRKIGNLKDQFLRFVIKQDGCWNWFGATTSTGYGCLRNRGKLYYAHRFSYELHNNVKLPRDVEVIHSCDNPVCTNPLHLTVGRHLENMHDAIRKGRISGIPLSEEDILRIRGMYDDGITQYEIANQYGSNQSYISRIVRMERRQNVTSI